MWISDSRAREAFEGAAAREATSRSEAADRLAMAMVAYQEGSLEAFEEIYRALSGDLRKYLLSLTLSSPLAEDLLQETFLQVHRSRGTYLHPRPVRPWAFGIARNVYLMDRRAWRRKRSLEDAGEDLLLELGLPAAVEKLADRDLVRRSFGLLSADQQEPLLLHHVWGFSFREIGGMLGIREGTAKVRAHRALEKLRSFVEKSS